MKLTRTRQLVLGAAAAFTLASASTAQAVIQVQKGITDIRLGMFQAQIKAGLGTAACRTTARTCQRTPVP
jgi:hypothetical protein